MSYTSSKTIQKNRAYEVSPLYIYGHSFTAAVGLQCTSGNEFFRRVQTHMAMSAITTYGISSSRTIENYHDVIAATFAGASAGSTWNGTRKGWTLLDCVTNDAFNFDVSSGTATAQALTAGAQEAYKRALDGYLTVISSSDRVESSAGTTSGTWTTGSSATYSGGSILRTIVQNSYVDIVATATAAGELDVVTFVVAGATNGTMDVSVDGTVVQTISSWPTVDGVVTRRSGNTVTAIPYIVKLTGLSAGSHTIRVKKTDATSNFIYVDCVLIKSASPVPAIILRDPLPNTTGSNGATTSGNRPIIVSNMPLLDALITSTAANYPNAIIIDPGLSNPADIGVTDGIHPNDRGMRKMADAIVAGIHDSIYDPDSLYLAV